MGGQGIGLGGCRRWWMPRRGGRSSRGVGSVFMLGVGLTALAMMLQAGGVGAFDNRRNDNLAVYWGQNAGGDQQRLSYYCQDDVINAIPLAFLYVFFGMNEQPMMSFARTCNEGNGTFPGTMLSNCTFLAPDIQECQSRGKILTLSLGGADSSVGFTSANQAEEFATTIWETFLGGEGDIRPFGNAVLDGVDLDIEGGLPTYYNNFVDKLREYTDAADKRYYITAAPQCPFPDAYVGPAINQSRFDAIYVQFYNNYCGLNYPDNFNFELWDTWARTQSPNRDVKIYIGAPGSATAANQGYVNLDILEQYALEAQGNYSTFGGVMLWDASDAYQNNRYDRRIKQALARNGQAIPDGGDDDGSGDSGGGTNSTSTPPTDNGGDTENGGTDGGGRTGPGVKCVHVQTDTQERFVIWKRDYGVGDGKLGREGPMGLLHDEALNTIDVLSEIARYYTGLLTSQLRRKSDREHYSRGLRKYKLYSSQRLGTSSEL